MIVTLCIRQSVNSSREDVVNAPDCPAPNVPVNVVDIDPPPGHWLVHVCDRPSGEKVIAAFIVAWFTATATMFCAEEVPAPEGVGADGLCPPQPPRRLTAMRHAPEGYARIGRILPESHVAPEFDTLCPICGAGSQKIEDQKIKGPISEVSAEREV